MTARLGERVRVLIVSLPGMMQNVLRDTFMCRSDVGIVGVASGCLSALGMIPDAQPDLVVIDSNLPDTEASQLILLLKDKHPPIQSLVVVETTQQYNNATRAGADHAIRSYSLPDGLDPVLNSLKTNHK